MFISESVYKKTNRVLGFVAIAVLFMVIALRAHTNIAGSDTWFHLTAGEYIIQHGIPTTEVFSNSVAGQEWIDHEWLWQVMIYSLLQTFGDGGIILLQALIVTTIFSILFLMGFRGNRTLLVVAILFSILIAHPTKSLMRLDMISLWFTVLYIFILWRFLKKSWSIYVLFILQVLWTNMHGFFILGPLCVLSLLASEYIKRYIPLPYNWKSIGRLNREEHRRLLYIGIALILACLINPYFVKGFWYPIKIMLDAPGEAKFFYSFVGELKKPISFYNLFYFKYLVYKLLIILSLTGFIINRRNMDVRVLILWLGFLGLSLVAKRNVIYFEVAAYLSLIINLSHVKFENILPASKHHRQLGYIAAILLHVGLIAWIGKYGQKMLDSNYFDVIAQRTKSSYGRLSDKRMARGATDFLIKHKIQGNFFNDLSAGHKLIGKNFPSIKVYIDGRTEVYGAEFFKTYLKILEEGNWDIFQQHVNQFNIMGVFLVSSQKSSKSHFLNKIYSHPEWKLVYFDHNAVIFLKDTERNKAIIDRYEVNLAQWQTHPADPRFFSYSALAKSYFDRALTLRNLNFYEQAVRELDEFLRIQPSHIKAMILKAQIYRDAGKTDDALNLFKQILSENPRSITAMMETALTYERVDGSDNAFMLSRKMIDQAPNDPRGHFVLSRMLAKNMQYAESFKALVRASQLNLDIKNIISMIDVLYDQKAYTWAQKACDLALTKNERTAEIRNKLKLILEAESTSGANRLTSVQKDTFENF